MSRVRNNSSKAAKRSPDALAHELANLLDGSLRHLGLAIASLREPVQHDESGEELLKRLEAADGAMQQMATLIHRWMSQPRSTEALFSQSRSIGQTIEHAVQLLSPAAALRSIEIRVDVAPQVRELAAGPIYPIIANALRNSIEAIGRADVSMRHTIEINGAWLDDIIELSVADTGPGLDASLVDESGRFAFGRSTKPRRGHGVGLQLSREIATSMGGELALANRSPRGAVLTLRVPVNETIDTDQILNQ